MEEEQKTARNFNELFEKHGGTYRALDWGSRESQELRFRILAGIGDLEGASILDVGCGLGHFYEWLTAQGLKFSYTGIDIADQLLQKAKNTHPDARFLVGSPSDMTLLAGETFDYVFASGIFSTYTSDSMTWMRMSIQRMWNWSRRGVAFNSLSTWAPETDSCEFYADPLEVVGTCKSLTPWISVRHDYHPRDFSVYLRHTSRQS